MDIQKEVELVNNIFKGIYPSLDLTVMGTQKSIKIFINNISSVIYNPNDFTPMRKFFGTDVKFENTDEPYEKLDSFIPNISNKVVIIGKVNDYGLVRDVVFLREYGTMDYNSDKW